MIHRQGPPDPTWVPDELTIANANLTAAMEANGFGSFADFHEWSIRDPDGFWSMVIDDIGITFDSQPESIRGSSDPTAPQWLQGATFNIVASCLDHDPDSLAVVSGGADGLIETTVGELSRLVGEFAAGYVEAGFHPGDAIAIVMPMNLEAVVAYLGTIAAGGVVVSIADSFASDEIAMRLEITEAAAVVTQFESIRMGRRLPMYAKCIEAGASLCIVAGEGELRDADVSWATFTVSGAGLKPLAMPASAHTNILFSSGTTGEPKAIPWNQTTPIKAAMDGRYHQDIHAGDVVAWPTNLGWMMGPWLIYASLLNGAAMALYDGAPTTAGFVDFVSAARVTMLGVVPSIVAAWRASGVLTPGTWKSIRVISSTGEASNADDSSWLMKTAGGVPVIEYCGGTEIGGGYVSSTVLHHSVPAHFATPTLGLDMVLVDEDGSVGDVGEVFLVPPSIGLSDELINLDHNAVYYNDVPSIGVPLRRHGDQMKRIGGGYMRALGRVDDTMNLGGIKVSSADLEGALSDIGGITEVAAVAVPPDGGGPERLVIFAVRDDGPVDPGALRAEMQERIRTGLNPLFKVYEVVLIDALPRTASHKVMRRSLRAGYVS